MQVGYRIQVWGRVQGVGFRYQTQQLAKRLAITGFVANQIDGSVLIEAEGTAPAIVEFIDAVKASPSPFGEVTRSQVDKIATSGYQDFKTR
ncbi:acylphosphatase [Periweissella ghanensis]|uniref:Acylphosphatase n=1 Tax=Periweissella ghanensis TaxID=467997 RepID=A0ABN8BRC9_9LACO|nr:acylphosphatase [Periweissella ghanensis]MCM0601428.1 acylphosphatase [Periweissella ghanensis]CAH0419491.1 Acylphosphatase [Periweissella ghanensis]